MKKRRKRRQEIKIAMREFHSLEALLEKWSKESASVGKTIKRLSRTSHLIGQQLQWRQQSKEVWPSRRLIDDIRFSRKKLETYRIAYEAFFSNHRECRGLLTHVLQNGKQDLDDIDAALVRIAEECTKKVADS